MSAQYDFARPTKPLSFAALPSPIPTSPRPLHTSRSFTANPLKTSGFSSDRDASGHLDIKRLMSKPAKQKQTPSGSWSNEASSSRAHSASHRPSEPNVSRPPLSRSATASREKLSLSVSTSGLRSSSAPGHGRTSSSPDRRPFPSDGAPQPNGKPRAVLRRRPSARSNPAAPVAAQVRSASDDPRSASAYASSKPTVVYGDTVFAMYSPPPSSTTRSVNSSRTGESPSSRRTSTAAALTPASAVALAYKQQAQRREELAETASYSEQTPTPPFSRRRYESASEGANRDDRSEEGVGAYYTVFGGNSGRLVAVGGSEDDLNGPVLHKARTSSGGARGLTRKVSGSLKKVAGQIKRELELRESEKELRVALGAQSSAEEWAPYDGSNVGHGRGSRMSTSARRPIVLDTAVHEGRSPRDSPVKYSPEIKNSASPQDDAGDRAKTKGKDGETSPGAKCTGGLRDKYQQPLEPPPPVPALPINAGSPSPTRTMDIPSPTPMVEQVSENGVLLRRFMQSRASMSGVRPSLATPPKTPPAGSRPHTSGSSSSRPSTTGNAPKTRASISGHRPTTTSSPDMTGVGFFHSHRAPSTKSSFSSCGDDIPPVPKHIGQHILPPSELSRNIMKASSELFARPLPKSASRSHSAPADDPPRRFTTSAVQNVLSLPLPPRRSATAGSMSTSPIAPSFNVEETIDSLMPPANPLPLTDSRRGVPPPAVEVPSRTQSTSMSLPRSPPTPRVVPAVYVDTTDLSRRPSTGALSYASTARPSTVQYPGRMSSPQSASQKRSPLTFREMSESPRQKLSEKEKADKWEDLLFRSAQAGGTLRVGDSHLMSEDASETGSVSMLHLSDSD
ncbi:uncharacterized protein BXZ73DRAFT_91740 [Epithele typhae]|uniref:uncharacterized protein n=1 Tax=Epithele typhae TaxID=378194 RepID=UPI00200832A9|nr:uncharacterized protein BXZ73DRAFT_91740 [Epithele typhae]KAH9921719.1 hypothetical protein BXZ73DRAFT_91740 [Epithele typhae]